MARQERGPQRARRNEDTGTAASLMASDCGELFPEARAALPAVTLRSAVRQPNVFRKRIAKVDPGVRAGDWVIVYAPRPESSQDEEEESGGELQIIGYGIYNPRSEIALRIVRFGVEAPDEGFWDRLLERAVSLRKEWLRLDEVANAYRVVHGEADGIPGLVVDRYDQVLSLEAFSYGMYLRGQEVAERLARLLGTRHWYVRTSPFMLSQEGIERPQLRSADAPRFTTISEFGTRFRIQLDEQSHKTGFFCDQRDNRKMLAGFCRDKTVLDLCCYTGGFSVQAKKLGGAAEVTGVDLDADPLELAKANANLNQVKAKFVQADVFPYMRDMLRSGRQFDVVVLDPPKLIRSRAELEEGARKHLDLNRLAIRLVKPGGLFLSCTCAGLLSTAEFTQIVARAARQAGQDEERFAGGFRHGRDLQMFAKTGAAADHPVSGNALEGEYLNAIWARVDDPS